MFTTCESGPAKDFSCPNCGAVYSVVEHRRSARDRDSADCVVCKQEMAAWNSTYQPAFKLKVRSAQKVPSLRPLNSGLASEASRSCSPDAPQSPRDGKLCCPIELQGNGIINAPWASTGRCFHR